MRNITATRLIFVQPTQLASYCRAWLIVASIVTLIAFTPVPLPAAFRFMGTALITVLRQRRRVA